MVKDLDERARLAALKKEQHKQMMIEKARADGERQIRNLQKMYPQLKLEGK